MAVSKDETTTTRLEGRAEANFFSVAKDFAYTSSQNPGKEAKYVEMTLTSVLHAGLDENGVALLLSPSGQVSFKPGLLSNEEALVLADTFLKILQGSAPELMVLRSVYLEPAIKNFKQKFIFRVSIYKAPARTVKANRKLATIRRGLEDAARGTNRNGK